MMGSRKWKHPQSEKKKKMSIQRGKKERGKKRGFYLLNCIVIGEERNPKSTLLKNLTEKESRLIDRSYNNESERDENEVTTG